MLLEIYFKMNNASTIESETLYKIKSIQFLKKEENGSST